MKNVRPAFEVFEGREDDIPKDYQFIFRRKARLVAGGHMTDTPNTLTYSSVVSHDSVHIALTIVALNELNVMACDIQNAYLTANCREKIWTHAGPEFGSESGSIMIVKKALYGLKRSGAAFRSHLAENYMTLGSYPPVLTQMCGADQLLSLTDLSIMNIYYATWMTCWLSATMQRGY